MKKQLQQDLKDLAREILKENQTMTTKYLQQKVSSLYQKISVLAYLEGQIDSDVSTKEEAFDSKSFREQNWFTEPEPIPQPDHKEDLVEPLMEKIKDLVAQMPPESQQVDKILEEVLPQKKYMKNDLEEFASNYQQTPTFERKTPPPNNDAPILEEREPSKGVDAPKPTKKLVDDLGMSEKPKSINDAVGDGMRIDLNDRLAYIKHLFGGSTDDYTRVLSQLNTFETFAEAETFIKSRVKPDYNFWLQKDMYAERFMAAVERKFS